MLGSSGHSHARLPGWVFGLDVGLRGDGARCEKRRECLGRVPDGATYFDPRQVISLGSAPDGERLGTNIEKFGGLAFVKKWL